MSHGTRSKFQRFMHKAENPATNSAWLVNACAITGNTIARNRFILRIPIGDHSYFTRRPRGNFVIKTQEIHKDAEGSLWWAQQKMAALLQNPNLPEKTWISCSQDLPIKAIENPSLPLWLLSNPRFFHGLYRSWLDTFVAIESPYQPLIKEAREELLASIEVRSA